MERSSGQVDPAYIWGAALDELCRSQPDARIVNLETSITRSEDYLDKGINYRMSPENASCLAAAGIDCCVLANNHVLDWGRRGLVETLTTLQRLGIATSGAGSRSAQASAPAILPVTGKGRVLIFSFALPSSGTPRSWAAKADAPGVNYLADLSEASTDRVCEGIVQARQMGDIIVVSLHWGPNWGYEVPDEQIQFAHALVDRAGVSVIHGHSSHHAKAIEVHRNRLILYGCGDFLNDYEGVTGYENFRDDLALMYFADVDPEDVDLAALEVVPLQISRFRLAPASSDDIEWMRGTLDRESSRFATTVVTSSAGRLAVRWSGKRV